MAGDWSDGYCPVDLMAGCSTVWPEAGWSSSRCAFGGVVWGNRNQLAGWLAGRRFAEGIMGAVLSDCCGRIPEWTQFREREHTKGDS
jgi:hypothetical protein